MIKLLKYDLRRNGTLLLGGIAVLFLCELILLWAASMEFQIFFNVLFFMVATIGFAISSLKVFDYNITSISRRLVPVNTLSYVWASLIYGVLGVVVLTLLGLGVGAYLYAKYGDGLTGLVLHIPIWFAAVTILEYIFMIIYAYLTFYVTKALARSIATRGVFWIGLVIFLILTGVTNWFENLLFARDSTQIFDAVSFHVDIRNEVISQSASDIGIGWNMIGSFLFELVLCVIYLFVIKWCVEKKIEAR